MFLSHSSKLRLRCWLSGLREGGGTTALPWPGAQLTEQGMRNCWTRHKKLLDMTDHGMRSWQIYRWCCEEFTGGSGGVMWETAEFHRKLGVSTGAVLGSEIVQGKQYQVTISAYPRKAEMTLQWYQKYQNSNSVSTGVKKGSRDWLDSWRATKSVNL